MLVENSNQPEPRILPATLEVYELLCVPVLAVDTGFSIVYINEKACEITGYSKEGVRDKKLFDIAAAGELKKKLLRLFAGELFERDFTVRSHLVTRYGRIRKVEWQCRTMFQGIFRAGAVITFVDLTDSETVLDMARIMAGCTEVEPVAHGFMDLLSDPLNLKLARILLYTDDLQTIAFFRAYPHGAVHKKPRQALSDNRDISASAEIFCFPLLAGGMEIGSLQLTPYGGSGLSLEDESYVRRLCDVFAVGVGRLITEISQDNDCTGDASQSAPSSGPGNSMSVPEPAGELDIARQLIDMLPHGVITCSQDGVITSINESAVRIFGMVRSELEGYDLRGIIRRLSPERVNGAGVNSRNAVILRALRAGNPITNARAYLQVNGSRRELAVSAIPVRDDYGNRSGYLASVQDITVFSAIVRMGRIALNVYNAEDLVEESLDLIMNAMSLRLASLYLWDGSTLKLEMLKGDFMGMPVPEFRDVPDHQSPTLPSRAYLAGKPLLIKDYRRCASVRLFDPLARRRPVRSMAGIPLMADGNVIGVLVAATGEGRPMDEARLAELSALCSQLSAGICRGFPPGSKN